MFLLCAQISLVCIVKSGTFHGHIHDGIFFWLGLTNEPYKKHGNFEVVKFQISKMDP